VRTLLGGGSSVLVTRQAGGAIVPIPFDELMDPKTGRTRVRMVDTSTASHESARALQVRMERRDLADPDLLAALARVTKLAPDELRRRYESACD
jgi:6-phosphofructokinase 1